MYFHSASEKFLDFTRMCHSWLGTVLLFKKSVLMDPSSGEGDLGGRAADRFFWVFGNSTGIHNI